MRELRFDAGSFVSPARTDNGYLTAAARITRIGVFDYLEADGSIRRELRLPEEVFSEDALRSFELVPLTNDHPGVPLDPTNTKRFKAGTISGVAVEDDAVHVGARIQIEDEEVITAVEEGKRELSCGYRCDLEFRPGVTKDIPGVPDGLRFDAIQRNIRGNHVALVTKGRAGESVRLRMDGASVAVNTPQETRNMKVTINGVTYEVDETVGQAITKALGDETARADAAEQKCTKLQAENEALTDKAEKATARADAAEAPERIREAVKARTALEAQARKVLGEEFKVDALSNDELKIEAVKKAAKRFDADRLSKDAAYRDARYDAVMEAVTEDIHTDHAPDVKVDDTRDDGESLYEKKRKAMIEENQNAYKRKAQA